ncbi:MAG: cytochrome c3 family protein [Bryobacterales bacterium]|nr:cytochrome c3 family protein [Bryobacterales bacterium]
MTKKSVGRVCISVAAALAVLYSAPEPEAEAIEQPVPFSHRVHSEVGIKCRNCHSLKDGFAAGLPPETTCMACHATVKKDSPAIRKLAEFARSKEPVPWKRVYEVPEYVWFSHQSHHVDAKIACEHCHGPVATRDVIVKEKPTSMQACMDCHAAYKAPNGCDFCHNTQ